MLTQVGYHEEDMQKHGGRSSLEDPDLIIFGRQSSEPENPPAAEEPKPTGSFQFDSPAANPTTGGSGFDFDPSPAAALEPAYQAPEPIPDSSALDQFTDAQKLMGLYHVLVKKRLVTEAEIAQELMKLWALGKLK